MSVTFYFPGILTLKIFDGRKTGIDWKMSKILVYFQHFWKSTVSVKNWQLFLTFLTQNIQNMPQKATNGPNLTNNGQNLTKNTKNYTGIFSIFDCRQIFGVSTNVKNVPEILDFLFHESWYICKNIPKFESITVMHSLSLM